MEHLTLKKRWDCRGCGEERPDPKKPCLKCGASACERVPVQRPSTVNKTVYKVWKNKRGQDYIITHKEDVLV